MKLAISNIAWDLLQDETVYSLMKAYGFSGLEIAPTRILPETPYERLVEAEHWKTVLTETYGFTVPSIQSIWYGRQEKLFGTDKERQQLFAYTKKAIDFASVIGCKNLVFGCPRNRDMPKGADLSLAINFFRELGDYAYEKGTVIGMEANPPIYHTNFINDTQSAIELIEIVNSKGFRLNLDVGTMIEDQESVSTLQGFVKYVNHVHISEPGLQGIERRELHVQLCQLLHNENYKGFISIERGKTESVTELENTMGYVKEIFGDA